MAALCLLGALLAVLLRRGGGELALLLVLAVCGVAVALLLEPLGQLRDFWEEASAWGQLPEKLFQPLLKTVCIALICRTGSDLCRDAGEGALASVLETAGAVAAIVPAEPDDSTAPATTSPGRAICLKTSAIAGPVTL